MLKAILFLLLYIPQVSYSMSKAPEKLVTLEYPIQTTQFEFYSQKDNSVYYETIPVVAQETNTGLLSLSPSISRNVLSGELKFQIWMAFRPTISPLGQDQLVHPNFLTISSMRHSITIPLLHKQTAYATNSINSSVGTLSKTKELAYMYLFPEDIHDLQLVLLDTEELPVEAWEPQEADKRLAALEQYRIPTVPSTHKIQDLKNFYILQKKEIKKNPSRDIPLEYKESTYMGIDPNSPIFTQQSRVYLTLHGKSGEQKWSMNSHQLWILAEILDFYRYLSEGETIITY